MSDDQRERLVFEIRNMLQHERTEAAVGPFPADSPADSVTAVVRNSIRASHLPQRQELIARESPFIRGHLPRLIHWFASGSEITPERIQPVIEPVASGHEYSDLFRLVTALWSVPVSRGFGRRMRFLVLDASNEKLIGIFALGDPVFNLRARDEWIGWNASQRRARLVSVMDGYVVGAVPPYNMLLGGKLVTGLIASRDVAQRFTERYGNSVGFISGQRKHAELAAVTISSALGRSSIYNRLHLAGLVRLDRLGQTRGYGHFHVGAALFEKMRALLQLDGHRYANGYAFGEGPSWRMRVIRESLRRVGLDGELVRHGIPREVFGMPLVDNWREYLTGDKDTCTGSRWTTAAIADAALGRWVIPRSQRMPEYTEWRRSNTEHLFEGALELGKIHSGRQLPLPLALWAGQSAAGSRDYFAPGGSATNTSDIARRSTVVAPSVSSVT